MRWVCQMLNNFKANKYTQLDVGLLTHQGAITSGFQKPEKIVYIPQ